MMTTTVLEARGLTKAYGRRLAVDDLHLEVERGEIFGFLGPNGAGKTTTIRMLLGLVRPTSGEATILGRDVLTEGRSVLPRVGALIEAPALYGYLSGRDNLRCVGDALGGVEPTQIDRVLDLVGLRDRQRDRVRTYSLGMKQRLGVAMALLGEPELLVLDEPANGLDPTGIVEIRRLLRRLAAAGTTIFVSSHVLAEVEEVCDRVAIVRAGRLVTADRVAELSGTGEFEVRIPEPHARSALDLVRSQPWGASARLQDGVLIAASPTGRGHDLLEFLVAGGVPLDGVSERRASLEDVFLRLTGEVR